MRKPQVTQLPSGWRRGDEISASKLNETTAAVQKIVTQLNAGGQVPRLATGLNAGVVVAVSSFPATFDPLNPSLLNVVRHPSLVGQTAEEFPVVGWFDTFPQSYDIYTYTYTSINTRDSDDGAASIIAEELTPRILVGATLLVSTVDIDTEEPPASGEFVTNTIEIYRQPGQWWASETLLGAGLGS